MKNTMRLASLASLFGKNKLLTVSLPFVFYNMAKPSYQCFFGFNFGSSLQTNKIDNRSFTLQYAANNPIEDRICSAQLSSIQGYAAAVFDGHGGWQMSDYASNNLIAKLEMALEKNKASITQQDELIVNSMNEAFDSVEKSFLETAKRAYNLGFPNPGRVGSCALLVVVAGNKVYAANAGDSQGIIVCDQGGKFTFEKLNKKLNADSKKEQARLKQLFPNEADIFVCKKQNNKSCYVKGRLQPTRSLGDFRLKYPEFNNPQNYSKEQGYQPRLGTFTGPYITHEPEIRIIQLQKKHKTIIMASDGIKNQSQRLWDELTKPEISDLVGKFKKGASELPSFLLEEALKKASYSSNKPLDQIKKMALGSLRRKLHDDISIIVIDLEKQRK